MRGPNSVAGESYARQYDNPFLSVSAQPLSTFSIDVDTASYANIRRFINGGQLPPPDAVRIEELLNYFDYDYPPPRGDAPFAADVVSAVCPWAPRHRLVRIGLKGRVIAEGERPACNLVFLIDVSGSMQPENKLPLLKQALGLLLDGLTARDRVAIVTYAGESGLALPSTTANNKPTIRFAIDGLKAGGSTNGGAGIQQAYDIARRNFIAGGSNRVILATDGDFNVGVTDREQLTQLIQQEAVSGVFLTVLGLGMGNLKDDTLEQLADKGNGHYGYIDTLGEARRMLVEQLSGTLVTIAKDVKVQVEFNPVRAAAYRLIGYENRMLAAEDFNDDRKDAGEIGAGHTVTALYEVVPAAGTDARAAVAAAEAGTRRAAAPDGMADGAAAPRTQPARDDVPIDGAWTAVPAAPAVDPLKYQVQRTASPAADSGELLTIKLRYKAPDASESKLLEFPVLDRASRFSDSPDDFRFAAAVAGFGMLLRGSPHMGATNLDDIERTAGAALGADPYGYRSEFCGLVRQARAIAPR